MPSGPRKRRTARRKKEMVEQMKTISSSDPSQDSGQGDDLVTEGSGEVDSHCTAFSSAPTSPSAESYYSLSSKEWSGSEAVDGVAKKNSENLEAEGFTEQDELELAPAVTEVAFLPKDESAAKSDELTESERGNSKTAEDSDISVDNAIGLTEERSQVTEVAADVLEEIPRGDREKAAEARGLDGVGKHGGNGRQIAGVDETLPTTKVQHSAPLVVHRSQWWNCCGLLDLSQILLENFRCSYASF
ncbi:uncharacterized protein LOC122054218 isoform X1 [Zingiber officinale]|uniref:uncharacterized protein LOC122054218 isoform X1 n=1 Tax=Zingiber officinale TaxID=94328 RepID=UPI001C4DA4B8|nr:uncharacterized protein LOC122054218 isoform X1 [Zingiber officinale]